VTLEKDEGIEKVKFSDGPSVTDKADYFQPGSERSQHQEHQKRVTDNLATTLREENPYIVGAPAPLPKSAGHGTKAPDSASRHWKEAKGERGTQNMLVDAIVSRRPAAPAPTPAAPAPTPAAPSQAAGNVKTDSGFGKRGFKPGGKTHQSMSPGSNTGAASPLGLGAAKNAPLDKSGDHIQKLIENYLGKNSGRRQKNSKKALSGIEKVKIPGWTPKTESEKAATVASNERKHAKAMRDRNINVPPGHGEAIEKIGWPGRKSQGGQVWKEPKKIEFGETESPRQERKTFGTIGSAPIRINKSDDIDVSLLVDIANLLSLDGDSQSFLEKVTYATTDEEREENKAKQAGEHLAIKRWTDAGKPRNEDGSRDIESSEDAAAAYEKEGQERKSTTARVKDSENPAASETSIATTDPDSTAASETSIATKDPDSTSDLSGITPPSGGADDEPKSTTSEPESTTEAADTSSTKRSVDPNFNEEEWMRETLSIGDDDTPSESVEPATPSKPADTTSETPDTPAKTGRMRAAGKKIGTGAKDFGTGFGEGFSGGREESSGGVNINIGGGTTGTAAGGAGATTATPDTSAADDASMADAAAATGDYKGEPTTKKPLSTPPIVPSTTTYNQTKTSTPPPTKTPPPIKTPPASTTAIKPTKPQTALGAGSSPTASPTAAITPAKTPKALGSGQPPTPSTSSSTDKPTVTSTIDKPIGKSWTYSG
jgi:hypothetical protein